MYQHPDFDELIEAEKLESLDPEIQEKVMEIWFRSKFEDPVHSLPYETPSGGYIYIYGWPYDAYEKLEAKIRNKLTEISTNAQQKFVDWLNTNKNIEVNASDIEDFSINTLPVLNDIDLSEILAVLQILSEEDTQQEITP